MEGKDAKIYAEKENLFGMSVSDICSDDSGDRKRNSDDWQRGNSANPESERWMVLSERRGKNRSDSSDNTSGRSGNSTGII
jgi:hypothetical protein